MTVDLKKIVLRHQVASLLASIDHLDEDEDVMPRNVRLQITDLFNEVRKLFGKGAVNLIVTPPADAVRSVLEWRISAESLQSYVDVHLGDPVARELIGDEVRMARWSLKQGFALCAVLLCRIAKEQAMRRLCERLGKEHPPTAQPNVLAQSLRKENGGPLEKYQWKELDAKLTFEGEAIHNRVKLNEAEVQTHIEWTDRFVDELLRN